MTTLFSFHPNADKKLVEIWLFGYHRWNEQQADKYIDELYDFLAEIANDLSHPNIKPIPNHALPDIKYIRYKRHFVFFREADSHLQEKIQVLTLLHDSMDIPARLREELDSI